MKSLKTLLASALVAGGAVVASAQSTTSPNSAGANANVSAATHCKNAQGAVQLKSAANTQAGGAATTSGTASTGINAAGSSGATGTGAAGMSGSGSGMGAGVAGSGTAAADLPNC